jgi:SPX domain protein involved in polyphosphate accumulation
LQVRDFITAQGSSLQDELRMLAAAAPELSLQDCQQLEQQANELGRQLLALEAYMQLNQAGFVKICKKHDKVSSSDSSRQQAALSIHYAGLQFCALECAEDP